MWTVATNYNYFNRIHSFANNTVCDQLQWLHPLTCDVSKRKTLSVSDSQFFCCITRGLCCLPRLSVAPSISPSTLTCLTRRVLSGPFISTLMSEMVTLSGMTQLTQPTYRGSRSTYRKPYREQFKSFGETFTEDTRKNWKGAKTMMPHYRLSFHDAMWLANRYQSYDQE